MLVYTVANHHLYLVAKALTGTPGGSFAATDRRTPDRKFHERSAIP